MADDGGLSRIEQRLRSIPKNVRDAVQPAVGKAAVTMADDMRRLAEHSRDTGALIDSIAVTGAGQKTPAYSQPGGSKTVPDNAVAITVGNKQVRYAHLVEYGTKKAPAQPFFWPAVRLNRKKAEAAIKRAIAKAVRDTWGRR